jgi:hypothetical protein
MPEPEARVRAVYDHNDDEPRPAGRRRRQVADWGVGEELFDGMPGRRFERRGAEHAIPRGGSDDGRRTIVITEDDVRIEEESPGEEFASRDAALEARRQHDAVWAGDEPFAPDAPADTDDLDAAGPTAEARERYDELVADPSPHDLSDSSPYGDVVPDGIVRGGVEGRRTVKIGGRPAEFHSAPSRRRPSRTVHERLGPRPDRIAAWAFALGLLLILIAVATASI